MKDPRRPPYGIRLEVWARSDSGYWYVWANPVSLALAREARDQAADYWGSKQRARIVQVKRSKVE